MQRKSGEIVVVGSFEEVEYRPNTKYEMQAYVTKYVNEGWTVAGLSEPYESYNGYVKFSRKINKERVDG